MQTSSYKCSFRLEVPVWYDVNDGVSPTDVGQPSAVHSPMAKPVLPVGGHSLEPAEDMQEGAGAAPAQEIEEGEAEDETYLVLVGYGCFSFQRGQKIV